MELTKTLSLLPLLAIASMLLVGRIMWTPEHVSLAPTALALAEQPGPTCDLPTQESTILFVGCGGFF